MARVSFDEIKNGGFEKDNGEGIKFFSLKNDGDSAVVRIMHDSLDDLDILTVHPVQVNGKYRSCNCIRNAKDPIEKCPLCEVGEKIQQRMFIHLLKYEADEQGNIVAVPCVWERTSHYANKLKVLMEEYGALSNCLFKIRRCGKAGDMNTTYEITYAPPQVYPEANYPKDTEVFKGYTACGTVVIDRPFADMQYFVKNGDFPIPNEATPKSPISNKNVNVEYTAPVNTTNVNVPPWEVNNTAVTPPSRNPSRTY